MIKLKKVTINKYKCIETEQSFDVEDDVTVLVGKNESGKTAILEAVAKSNSNTGLRFDMELDIPRSLSSQMIHTTDLPPVITCEFSMADEFLRSMHDAIGPNTFVGNSLEHCILYDEDGSSQRLLDFELSLHDFLDFKINQFEIIDEAFEKLLRSLTTIADIDMLTGEATDDQQRACLAELSKYTEFSDDLDISLHHYVNINYLEPRLPKYLYYDEYYQLPAEINLREIHGGQLVTQDAKTSQALLELADIDIQVLLSSDDEKIERALEDASLRLTETLRKYWSKEDAPRIKVTIPPASIQRGQPALAIRVENNEHAGSLPLESRSRGFKYFFSFMVWFSKIQEDKDVRHVLLLDEPGLSLHATAQAHLLGFLEDLANSYQIIYTTHSQFMIDFAKLNRVRAVSKIENQPGTQVTENLNSGARDALLLLQAALGYNIAQSLFIGENNLIVEGYSDYLYIQTMSSILRTKGREGLSHGITIVPVAGVDKAASFIALFRGNGLEIVSLLDTIGDSTGKQRIDDLIQREIIKEKNVRYFDEFADRGADDADIEDLFSKCEYLRLYNGAFEDRRNIAVSELEDSISRITQQIRKILKKHYNHTRPAKYFARIADEQDFLSQETLDKFESMFQEVNKRFKQ